MRNDAESRPTSPTSARAESAPSALRSAMEAGITGGLSTMPTAPQPREHRGGRRAAESRPRRRIPVATVVVVLLVLLVVVMDLWFGLNQPSSGTATDAAATVQSERVAALKPHPSAVVPDGQDDPVIYARPRGLPAN